MLKLGLDAPRDYSRVRSRIENIYDQIAGNDDYWQNDSKLRLIQACVITVSAVATGGVNAFGHRDRIGLIGASVLALLIMGFVEVFYFTLRHGLVTTYKSGMQRLAATVCYRTIQITMILNTAVLCVWVVGETMPPFLAAWNRWSIAIHFTLALVGVAAVRDSDPVVAHRILELKAETARQDIITLRKAAMLGNPLVLFAAKLRGLFDGIKLARQLLQDRSGFPSEFAKENNYTDRNRLDHISARSGLNLPGEFRANSQVAAGIIDKGEHNGGEQLYKDWGEQQTEILSRTKYIRSKHRGEQRTENGALVDRQQCANKQIDKDSATAEPSIQQGEQTDEPPVVLSPQWLKSILPEPLNGWWDVRDKGKRLVVKFRWRDPDLQVITLLGVTIEQFEALNQSGHEAARGVICEQVVANLHNLSIDSARRAKALIVAQKLGINLEDHESVCG